MHVRVMTYNIKSGRYRPDSLEAVAGVIEAQSPDVLAIQEVDEGLARTQGIAQTDWLARRLKMRGLFAPAMAHDGGSYGIALLSHWPAQAHERRLLFRPQYADAARRPRHDSEQRVMLGALLAQPAPYGGSAGSASDCALKIVVTHLGLTPDQRARQAQELAGFARTWQGDAPTLIAGDFNCDPGAPELAPLRESFQEACALACVEGEARYTFPAGALGTRTADGWRGAIDHLWVSPGVRIRSARVIYDETRASDHQPLVADCEIC